MQMITWNLDSLNKGIEKRRVSSLPMNNYCLNMKKKKTAAELIIAAT
jgi:hypothetical protein